MSDGKPLTSGARSWSRDHNSLSKVLFIFMMCSDGASYYGLTKLQAPSFHDIVNTPQSFHVDGAHAVSRCAFSVNLGVTTFHKFCMRASLRVTFSYVPEFTDVS